MLLLEGMASLPAGEGAAAARCHATGRAWLCRGEAGGGEGREAHVIYFLSEKLKKGMSSKLASMSSQPESN